MVDEKEIGVQKESVKLIKNSKGYTWELKIIPVRGEFLDDMDFDRLKLFNSDMVKKYGGQNV